MTAAQATAVNLDGFDVMPDRPARQFVADRVYARDVRLAGGDIAVFRPRESSHLVAIMRGRFTVAVGSNARACIAPSVIFVPPRLLAQFYAQDSDAVLLLIAPCPPEAETDAGILDNPDDVVICRQRREVGTEPAA